MKIPFVVDYSSTVSSLLTEYKWLSLLKNRNKPYEAILDYLIRLGEIENRDEDNNEGLNSKNVTIAKVTGVSGYLIRKWMFEIYDDLFDLNETDPDLFKESGGLMHELTFNSYFGGRKYFNLWFPCRLQVGDHLRFDFIVGKLGEGSYTVDKVYVTHQFGISSLCVGLSSANLSNYEKLLFEKMIYAGEIKEGSELDMNGGDIRNALNNYRIRGGRLL